jgi:hypothetical protein
MGNGWNRLRIVSVGGFWSQLCWNLVVLLPHVRADIMLGPLDTAEMYHVCNNILLKAFIRNEPQGAAIQRVLLRISNNIMEQQKSCNNFGESRNGNWIKLFHMKLGIHIHFLSL